MFLTRNIFNARIIGMNNKIFNENCDSCDDTSESDESSRSDISLKDLESLTNIKQKKNIDTKNIEPNIIEMNDSDSKTFMTIGEHEQLQQKKNENDGLIPYNSYTEICETTAHEGNFDAMKNAHENGGELNDVACNNALEYGMDTGDFKCYKYIMALHVNTVNKK